jgi:RNA polymerase sigma-70 factor, ECF subfamily
VIPDGGEQALVRRLRAREESAFNEIVRLYQHKVFNLVFRMLGDRAEAEDLAQDVFVTVFRSVEQFRGESKFSTWLYRVAANHCKNRLKYLGRRHQKQTSSYEDAVDAGRDPQGEGDALSSGAMPGGERVARPDELLEGYELEKLVQAAIASLDEEHRLLVVLRDIEELSYEEIVVITGLPEGTVKSRLHRARLALREKLERLEKKKK